MIPQIRAETIKVRSTRTTLGLVLGMVAIILLFVVLTALLTSAGEMSGREQQRNLFSIGSVAGLFAALAGIMLVTGEYRFGTIRPTILFNPARSHVLAAKVVVGVCGTRIRDPWRGDRLGDRLRTVTGEALRLC